LEKLCISTDYHEIELTKKSLWSHRYYVTRFSILPSPPKKSKFWLRQWLFLC